MKWWLLQLNIQYVLLRIVWKVGGAIHLGQSRHLCMSLSSERIYGSEKFGIKFQIQKHGRIYFTKISYTTLHIPLRKHNTSSTSKTITYMRVCTCLKDLWARFWNPKSHITLHLPRHGILEVLNQYINWI